ncbi:hypothetical protein Enr17x_50520 [Gimesia fumaroli]|uniref:Uncharacterized protein n=1 Tax=Gimesia fumaroli TaxID=2527976 RepID=A0A518IIR0_9PLAN|nr:hypothetical protein Enr17x_50520 [Gimesia fumaroli]
MGKIGRVFPDVVKWRLAPYRSRWEGLLMLFVNQIVCSGVKESRGKGILLWGGWWLSVCRMVRGVGWAMLVMRRCVSTRITFGGFHLENRAETSGFLQVRLKPVSEFHLNQYCSRARRISFDKLANRGFASSAIFAVTAPDQHCFFRTSSVYQRGSGMVYRRENNGGFPTAFRDGVRGRGWRRLRCGG